MDIFSYIPEGSSVAEATTLFALSVSGGGSPGDIGLVTTTGQYYQYINGAWKPISSASIREEYDNGRLVDQLSTTMFEGTIDA